MTIRKRTALNGDTWWYCPACGAIHAVKTEAQACCGWQGDDEAASARQVGGEAMRELTGGSSEYYRLHIAHPLDGEPYDTQCLDVINALGMTFAEGEAFKAIWRKAAARQGNGKPGHSPRYDAEKVEFYGRVMVGLEAE